MKSLTIGDRVAAVDALCRIHRGVIVAVPREWRDKTRSAATTTRGQFPKAWVQFIDRPKRPVVPWPLEDIAMTVADAERRAAQLQSERTAKAVLENPELRQRFDAMVEETASREPVPDDFKWLTAAE